MRKHGWPLLLLIGGTLLIFAVGYGGWLAIGPATYTVTMVHIGLWLPVGPLILAISGLTLWGVAGLIYLLRSRRKAPAPSPAEPRAPSAFAVDPWHDTVPLPSLEPGKTPAERVAALTAIAWDLESRGRLRAAREMYRQAYEIALADATLAPQARATLIAWRKVDRRLALRERPWWWRWLHDGAPPG